MKEVRLGYLLLGGVSLGTSLMACRPVITVGWGEILILALILALFVSPLVIRFLRRKTRIDKDYMSAEDDQNTD